MCIIVDSRRLRGLSNIRSVSAIAGATFETGFVVLPANTLIQNLGVPAKRPTLLGQNLRRAAVFSGGTISKK